MKNLGIKILNTIGEKFSREAKVILGQIGNVDYLALGQKELENKIAQYDVLLVGFGLNINKAVITKAKNLKVIASPVTGLDHIDLGFAKEKGIRVLSLQGETEFLSKITSTAELAFGLIIALLRKIPFAFEAVKRGEWQREKFRGHCLKGKTLGVVGLGRLGRMAVKYAKAFEMQVLAYDPHVPEKVFQECGCQKVELATLLIKSDILTLHLPLNEETEGMFNPVAFAGMKQGALLVNTSRGKIVDEVALLNALRGKKLGGYATDVLAEELTFAENCVKNPLVEYAKENNNVLIVPHIGGMTEESREATDIFIAQKLKKFLQKQSINNQ